MARQWGPRDGAVQAVCEVWQGRSLATVLPELQRAVAPGEWALCQELCYGVLRWQPRLEAVLGALLEKPLRAKDQDLKALLLIGLYQLGYLGLPAHAAVSETVAAVSAGLNKGWAKGLINALLRRFQREREALERAADGSEVARYAHPEWLLQRVKTDWPEQWQRICAANNQRPPMTLRVNRRKTSREAYRQALSAEGIASIPHSVAEDALTLDVPTTVERLPGFARGAVSVQDAAAQLAAGLMALQPGLRVLDACAAPGGKTGHILEAAQVEVTALDRSADRLAQVWENLSRLGLTARLVEGDAGAPARWWDGDPYDRILLDAPCSATGVIRRHPDIKALRRPEDIPVLASEQRRLLRALWPLLKPGGMLVYATCSILREENDRQVTAFMAEQEDARELPWTPDWGMAVAAGRQILPGQDGMDGFYYARLGKQ